jgi:hypothetical protein
MVLFLISKSTEEFCYECKATDSVDQITTSIAELHNTRLRIKRLAANVKQLALYGPMKAEAQRGLSEEQINSLGSSSSTSAVAGADPLGIRLGQSPDSQLQITLNRVATEAEAVISNNLAQLRKPINPAAINDALQNIKGAVMMAYPQGLPDYDVVKQGIDNKEELSGSEDSKYVLEPATAVLWFAGKQMDRTDSVGKYTGKNDKVVCKAKIERREASAPAREPAVDEETRRKMMQLWHKKDQESKALAEADEDSYLNAEWANPKQYKTQMIGMGNISFRSGR